jgi:hypothetical protein
MMGAGPGCRDCAAENAAGGGRGEVAGRVSTAVPRGKEGTHPGRNSRVWNVATPLGPGRQ